MTDLVILDDAAVRATATPGMALDCMRRLFATLAEPGAVANFPVVREFIGVANAVYGIKSGIDRATGILGLKTGGYWPGNDAAGLPRHQSTILLSDPKTGRPTALVAGNAITALRTAAAAAVSIDLLARRDATTLGVIGAGAQALPHVLAALEVRPIERIVVWNRDRGRAQALADAIPGPASVAPDAEALVARCDIVITITSATAPLFDEASVRPGTHFACMGSDTAGKREAPDGLLRRARIFTDDIDQSLTLGECQHGTDRAAIKPLAHVVAGMAAGRSTDTDITLYDGTGLGLQDLVMADMLIRTARDRALHIPF